MANISQTQRTVDLISQMASKAEAVLESMSQEAAQAAEKGEHQALQLIAEDISDFSRIAQSVLEHRERGIRRTGSGN